MGQRGVLEQVTRHVVAAAHGTAASSAQAASSRTYSIPHPSSLSFGLVLSTDLTSAQGSNLLR